MMRKKRETNDKNADTHLILVVFIDKHPVVGSHMCHTGTGSLFIFFLVIIYPVQILPTIIVITFANKQVYMIMMMMIIIFNV